MYYLFISGSTLRTSDVRIPDVPGSTGVLEVLEVLIGSTRFVKKFTRPVNATFNLILTTNRFFVTKN